MYLTYIYIITHLSLYVKYFGLCFNSISLYNKNKRGKIDIMKVLEKIESLRKEKGWSINYLAMESGLTQSTLNNLYSRNTEPKISTLRAICGAFGISLSDFFKEEANEDELTRRVKSLSQENKTALLQLLKNIK